MQARDIIKTFLNIRLWNGRITDIKDVKSFCRSVPDRNCKQPFPALLCLFNDANEKKKHKYKRNVRERERGKRKIMRRCI